MKKITLLFSSIIFSGHCFSQVMFEITYSDSGTYSETPASVKQTSDNGYIITGSRANYSTMNTVDMLLVKTNSNGSLLWSKTFGGDSADFGNAVVQTSDDGYFIAGFTESFPPGDSNVYAIRTNASGDTVWTKNYGGAGYDEARDAKQTASGGFIMVGTTRSFGSGSQDIYVICTDANGDTLWTKAYGRPGVDIGSSIQLTSDGGYIICGQMVSSSVSANTTLIKIDSIGNLMWAKTYYLLAGPPNQQRGNAVKQTTDGGYIMVGDNYIATCIYKTDASGNFQWGTYCTMGPEFCFGMDIVQTAEGGYVLTSTEQWFPPTYYIVLAKLDTAGTFIWSKSFAPEISSEAYSLVLANDEGYAIAGHTAPMSSWGDFELCLIKTNTSGFNGCQSNFPVSPVSAAATTDSGCVVSATQTVAGGTYTVITALPLTTVNYCFATNMDENRNSNLTLFPNPVTNELVVRSSEFSDKAKLEIYNILGEKVYCQQTTNNKRQTIDVSQLSPGIYFVRERTGNGISTAKFVKQ